MQPYKAGRIRALSSFRAIELCEDRVLCTRFSQVSAVFPFRAHAPQIRVESNIVYENNSGRVERLDIYEPSRTAPIGGWPVVVAIHGGGWRKFDKVEYGKPIAAQFVPNGYAVVAPNYRLSTPKSPSWPANLNDLRTAINWVRTNAASQHFDSTHITAMGESAGGHLAALLGADPGSPAARVDAVVAFYPPTDLTRLAKESRGGATAAAQFLGGTPQEIAATYSDASPISHIAPGNPPMMLVQGAADTLVPPDQASSFAKDLTLAGVPNQLVIVPRAMHGFEFKTIGQRLLPQILAFLSANTK